MSAAQFVREAPSIGHSVGAKSVLPGAATWIPLIILTMPVREISLWELGSVHGRIGDMVLAGAFSVWFAAGSARGSFRLVRNQLDAVVVGFLLYYGLSLIWADNPSEGVIRLGKLERNGMLYIVLVDYLSADFPDAYKRLAVCLLITGLMQSVAFMWSMAEHGGVTAIALLLQAESVQSNNNILDVVRTNQGAGIFLRGAAIWLPLCMFVGYGIVSGIRSWAFALSNRLLILIMGALTILGVSRAAWIGLVAGFGVIWLLALPHLTKKKLFSAGAATLLVLLVAWHFNAHSLIMSRIALDEVSQDPAVIERLDFYAYTMDRFAESPILGTGVASISPDELFIVHNLYLQILGELGIVGGGLFVWIMGLWSWYLVTLRNAAVVRGDQAGRQVVASLLGLTLFFFVSFLSGNDLGGGEPWVIMGIASAMYTYGRQQGLIYSRSPLLQPGAVGASA